MTGLVVPMEKEARALVERLDHRSTQDLQGRALHSGSIAGTDVRLIVSGCGKIRSASATQLLLDRFACSRVIHFGSAGALSPELRIGDIAIGDEIVEHDWIALFGEPDPHPISRSDSGLASAFQAHATRAGARTIRGRLLSGNEDIVTTARRDHLASLHDGLTVDWESAACAQVCNLAQAPALVLRAVSDYAYEGTHHEFSTHVEDVSARLATLVAAFIAENPA